MYRRLIVLFPSLVVLPTLLSFGQASQQPRPRNTPPAAQTAPQPQWVWAKGATGQRVYLRQPFRLSDVPELVQLRVASRGSFTVFLNGGLMLRGAGDATEKTIFLTRYVFKGPNVLAIESDAGRETGGVRFTLSVRYRDGRVATVVSNGDERVSTQEAPGWNQAAFDDSRWAVSVVAGTEGPVPEAGPKAAPIETVRPIQGDLDYSRLVRVWDLQGGRSGDVYARPREVGERMVMSSRVAAPGDLSLLASAGFTLLESTSDYLSTEETAPGVWDFRRPDADLRLARDNDFDWSYFPHFAFPPKWYRDSVKFTRVECLEHRQPIPAFSPWDPKFATFVDRGYQKLADKYASRNGASGLYLGVHGDFGETGFFTGARAVLPDLKSDWQHRFGNLHDHIGWWCGDPLARTGFRDEMMRKYRDLDILNAAWKTKLRSPDEITYPESVDRVARRYWLDFVNWYRDATSRMADTVCNAARRRFPNTLLTLPVGFGNEDPRYGNDNSALPKLAARHRVEVRSTHGGFVPFAESQATMFGRLASACRFYGAPLWNEPAQALSPEQQVGRMFASVSLGTKGYFDWPVNVRQGREVYYRNAKYLRVERPVVDVAMFFPSTSHLLRPEGGYPRTFQKGCTDIRDVLNYDIVDENMVRDGALTNYRVLVMWEGTVVEADVLAHIRDWVQNGGVLAAYDFGKIETVEGDRDWFNEVFGYAGRLKPAGPMDRFVATGPLPARYRVAVGDPGAQPYLSGTWKEPEVTNGVSRRWSGGAAEARLPLDPRVHRSLVIRASFTSDAARPKHEVLVNGVKVGEIDVPEETTYSYSLPAAAIEGKEIAVVSLRSPSPAGVRVTYLQMEPPNAPVAGQEPGLPPGRFETALDVERLRADWAKPLGRGWTVYCPVRRQQLPTYYEVVRYLAYHLSDLDATKKDAISVDNAWDGIYATLLSDKILYYNPRDAAVTRSIVLPPAAFSGRTDLVTPAAFNHTVALEPNSIGAIYFEAPPQEMLYQCEGFRSLGSLKPVTGAGFSPGQGPTHVLLPVGGQISTRIQVDMPGRYRVFYRAVRRGAVAPAEVSVDGVLLRPRSQERLPGAATQLAGTVQLSRGVHTLSIQPRRGEDIRADFIVLSSDPTVAGYGFGVRTGGP
jgi:hypothetical protein